MSLFKVLENIHGSQHWAEVPMVQYLIPWKSEVNLNLHT